MSSSADSERLVGSITSIQWDSRTVTFQEKTESFFSSLSEILALISRESSQDTFCSVILFVSLLRVIQCTAVHPRLALLTGTLAKAADNLLHALYLILLLTFTFAAIANWRFGSYRPEFSTVAGCCLMNFMMMFGEFPEDWAGLEQPTPLTPELIIYVFLYFIFVFLLMQNYLLAIIGAKPASPLLCCCI